MFYAMIYGCLPFSATDKEELIDMILNSDVDYPETTALTNAG
jgi:hypothetical protein|tara:strand:- start:360 stop:485 length:126 start_codon:yes stop_codon:yes gene_type:complete